MKLIFQNHASALANTLTHISDCGFVSDGRLVTHSGDVSSNDTMGIPAMAKSVEVLIRTLKKSLSFDSGVRPGAAMEGRRVRVPCSPRRIPARCVHANNAAVATIVVP